MNLFFLSEIKEILARYDTRPSKGLGQNFLIDKNILGKIVKTADISPDDIILEVGPGIGTLTQELAKHAEKVVAVEKDQKMCEILEETLKDYNNVEIVNEDILRYKIQDARYKVVANIPYYLTSPLIRKFLELPNPPSEMVLMLQKEVAQRICAKAPDMNLLAVSVQFYAEPKIISYVSKNCFWPAPKIDSAIIEIKPKAQNPKPKINSSAFFKIVKAGFSQPRKQLLSNLCRGLEQDLPRGEAGKEEIKNWLEKNKIKPTQRAETLSIESWIGLAKTGDKFLD